MEILQALKTVAESIKAWTISKLLNKVDKIDGKDLSTNDYTTEEKNKLAGISDGATKINSIADVGSGMSAQNYEFMGENKFAIIKPTINIATSDSTYVNHYVLVMELDITKAWGSYQSDFLIQDIENAYSGHFHWKCRVGADISTISANNIYTLATTSNILDGKLVSTYVIDNNYTTFRLYLQLPNNFHSYNIMPINTSYNDVTFKTSLYGDIGYSRFYEEIVGSPSINNAVRSKYDSNGQQIDTTYVKAISMNNKKMVYTKGDGTTSAVTITADDVNAAPSGYVADRFSAASNDEILSVIETVVANTPDTRMRVVRVHITVNELDLLGGSWFFTIYRYNSSNYSVTAKHASSNYVARRAMTSGVLGDWEWDNPPMVTDTEYRTTERINKKVVLRKVDSSGRILYRLSGETVWKPYATAIGAEIEGAAATALTEAKSYTDTAISNSFGLPKVTEADNGKILMVIDGAWKVIDINLTVDSDGTLQI